jgi:hypothetical protein
MGSRTTVISNRHGSVVDWWGQRHGVDVADGDILQNGLISS